MAAVSRWTTASSGHTEGDGHGGQTAHWHGQKTAVQLPAPHMRVCCVGPWFCCVLRCCAAMRCACLCLAGCVSRRTQSPLTSSGEGSGVKRAVVRETTMERQVHFQVERLKMALPFGDVLCAHSEVPALCGVSERLSALTSGDDVLLGEFDRRACPISGRYWTTVLAMAAHHFCCTPLSP